MSFSSEVKAEICKNPPGKQCCALAEAYGALLYANTFSPGLIRIITQSDAFAARLPKLFQRAFDLGFDTLPPEGASGKRSFLITDRDKLRVVFSAFGYDPERVVAHSVNLAVVEKDCDRVSFLRGAFLAGGSVTDPAGRYHLELATSHAGVCRQMPPLFSELGFQARNSRRGAGFVTYFKRSDAIEDLLTTLGAPLCAMRMMETKVEKHMTNAMNRLTNCDMANADKVTDAARAQLDAIRAIDAGPGLDSLPPALHDTALLRIANPSCSLADLAQLANPPVTKSCISHRLRKLVEYSLTFSREKK